MSTDNPSGTGKAPETDRNAPPIGDTRTRDDVALPDTTQRRQAPSDTESADLARDTQELRNACIGLAPGRIVAAVVRGQYPAGAAPVTRPAIVVSLTPKLVGVCNLQIFLDPTAREIVREAGAGVVAGVGYN